MWKRLIWRRLTLESLLAQWRNICVNCRTQLFQSSSTQDSLMQQVSGLCSIAESLNFTTGKDCIAILLQLEPCQLCGGTELKTDLYGTDLRISFDDSIWIAGNWGGDENICVRWGYGWGWNYGDGSESWWKIRGNWVVKVKVKSTMLHKRA